MPPPPARLALLLTAAAGLSKAAAPQTPIPPTQPPAAPQRLPALPGSADEPVFTPTTPPAADGADAGLTRGIPWDNADDTPAMLAEGTFITARRGRALPGPAGMWIFVPARDERLPGERPMLLAPSLLLERVVASIGEAPSIDCEVAGRILAYHNRNYLVLSAFRPYVAARPTQPTADRPTPGPADPANPADANTKATPAQPADQASTAADPEVDALIAELTAERSAQPSRPTTARAPRPARRPAAPQNATDEVQAAYELTAREGAMLVRRRGRVTRGQGGAWMFTIDNDTQTTGAAFTLIPSRLLERIESIAELEGEIRAMSISGRVMSFDGEQYLLPTSFRIEHRDGVNPMQ